MLNSSARFRRLSGMAMVAAGVLMLTVGVLTALMPPDQFRASPLFVWRMTAATALAALLLLGSIGIYADHPRAERLGVTVAFALAFFGSACLLANEWQELFLARDLAARFPGIMERLDDVPGLTPFDWGALIAVCTFSLGWIAFSLATLLTPAFSKWGGGLVIGGMFAFPASAALMPVGPVVASAILAAGFALLGWNLLSRRSEP